MIKSEKWYSLLQSQARLVCKTEQLYPSSYIQVAIFLSQMQG